MCYRFGTLEGTVLPTHEINRRTQESDGNHCGYNLSVPLRIRGFLDRRLCAVIRRPWQSEWHDGSARTCGKCTQVETDSDDPAERFKSSPHFALIHHPFVHLQRKNVFWKPSSSP